MELATDVNVSTVFAERRHVFQLWREKNKKKSERQRQHETRPVRADRRGWGVEGRGQTKSFFLKKGGNTFTWALPDQGSESAQACQRPSREEDWRRSGRGLGGGLEEAWRRSERRSVQDLKEVWRKTRGRSGRRSGRRSEREV